MANARQCAGRIVSSLAATGADQIGKQLGGNK